MSSGFQFGLEALDLREQASRLYLSQFTEYQEQETPFYENNPKHLEISDSFSVDQTNRRRTHSYKCKNCEFRSFSSKKYLYHRRNVHQDPHAIHECKLCSYSARHLNKMERHSQAVHKIQLPESGLIRRKKKSKNKIEHQVTIDDVQQPNSIMDNVLENNEMISDSENDISGQSQIISTSIAHDVSSNVESKPSTSMSPVQSPKTIFKCTKCNFQSLSRFILNQHDKAAHQVKKLFRCVKCAFVTNDRLQYNKHLKIHSLRQYACEFCSFAASYHRSLIHHLKQRHNIINTSLDCNVNFKGYSVTDFNEKNSSEPVQDSTDSDNLNSTNYQTDNNQLQTCKITEKDTINNSYMPLETENKNLNKIHGTEIAEASSTSSNLPEYPCPLCGMVFKTLAWLARHLTQKHKQSQSVKLLAKAVHELEPNIESAFKHGDNSIENNYLLTPSEETETIAPIFSPMYQDIVEPNMTTKLTENLERGTINHTVENIHISDIYSSPNSAELIYQTLTARIKEISASKDLLKRSKVKKNMTKVSKLTSRKTKAKFRNKKTFTTEEQPMNNSQPDDKGTLEKHKTETDSFISSFVCRVCDYRETSITKIENHIMSHRKGKIFSCHVCNYRCRWKVDMKRHLNREHDKEDCETFENLPNPLFKDIISEDGKLEKSIVNTKKPLISISNEHLPFKKPKTKAELMALLESQEKELVAPSNESINITNSVSKSKNMKRPQTAKKSCASKSVLNLPRKPKRTLTDFWGSDASNASKTDKCYTSENTSTNKICDLLPDFEPPESVNQNTQEEYELEESSNYSSQNKRRLEAIDEFNELENKPEVKIPKIESEQCAGYVSDKQYKCIYCPFTSLEAARFHVHIVQHLNTKPYMCSVCLFRSNWEWDIAKHIKAKIPRDSRHKKAEIKIADETGHKNYEKYNIYLVDMEPKVSTLKDKKLKMETSSTSTAVSSDALENIPEIKDQLFESLESPVSDTLFRCGHCFFKHPEKNSVVSHLGVHSETKPYECKSCGLVSCWKHVISRHINSAHGGKSGNLIERLKYELRGQLIFLAGKTDDTEEVIPSNVLQCHLCPYTADFKHHIQMHLVHHIEPEGRSVKCPHCPYWVKFKKSLTSHLRLHESSTEDISTTSSNPDPSLEAENYDKTVEDELINNESDDDADQSRSVCKYLCEYCPFSTKNKERLLSHKQFHSENKNALFTCRSCNYWSKSEIDWNKHKKSHEEIDKTIKSPTPLESFQPVIENNEITAVSSQIKYKKTKSKALKLVSKIKKTIKVKGKIIKPKSVSSKFDKHIKIPKSDGDFHNSHTAAGSSNESKFHFCESCSFKSSSNVSFLRHKQFHRHNPNAPFRCTHCSFWSSQKQSIRNHSKLHKREISKDPQIPTSVENTSSHSGELGLLNLVKGKDRYKCAFCPLTSMNSVNIERHQILHCQVSSTRYRYFCQICGYQNKSKTPMMIHEKLHKNDSAKIESNLESEATTENVYFPSKSNQQETTDFTSAEENKGINMKLKKMHRQLYYCNSCPAIFYAKRDKEKHSKLHSALLPYACPICSYTSRREKILQRHMAVHSPGYAEKRMSKCDEQVPKLVLDLYSHNTTTENSDVESHQSSQADMKKESTSENSTKNSPGYQKKYIIKKHSGTSTSVLSKPDKDLSSEQDQPQLPIERLNKEKTSKKNHKRKYVHFCTSCPAIFYVSKAFKMHCRLHGASLPYSCSKCNYKARHPRYIQRHMIVHAKGYRGKRMSEKNCAEKAHVPAESSPENKSTNLNLNDSDISPTLRKKKYVYYKFGCTRCPSVFNAHEKYLNHMSCHGLSLAMSCSYCDFGTESQFQLQLHERVHAEGYRDKFKKATRHYITKSSQENISTDVSKVKMSTLKTSKVGESEVTATDIFTIEKRQTDLYCKNQGKGINHKRKSRCNKCPMAFFNENELSFHRTLHQSHSGHKCPKCSYTVGDLDLLNKHKMLHKKSLSLLSSSLAENELLPTKKDSKNDDPDTDEGKLSDVISAGKSKIKTPKMKFERNKCNQCPAKFCTRSALKKHTAHHGAMHKFTCDKCNYSVNFSSLLSRHIKVHGGFSKVLSSKVLGLSKKPDSKTQELSNHLSSNEELYKCEKCPSIFHKQEKLDRHFKCHGAKRQYSCDECDYSVGSVLFFVKHARVHRTDYSVATHRTDVKPPPKAVKPLDNKTEVSSKAISQFPKTADKPTLSNSDQISLAKSLPSEPDTTELKAIPKIKALKYMKTKSRFSCSRCPYSSLRRENTSSHLKRHHGTQNTQSCPYCDYTTPSGNLQKDHIRLHFQRRNHLKVSGFMKLENFEIWDKSESPNLIYKDNGIDKQERFFPELVWDVPDANSFILDDVFNKLIPVIKETSVDIQMSIGPKIQTSKSSAVNEQLNVDRILNDKKHKEKQVEHVPDENMSDLNQLLVGEQAQESTVNSKNTMEDQLLFQEQNSAKNCTAVDKNIPRIKNSSTDVSVKELDNESDLKKNTLEKVDSVLTVINNNGSVNHSVSGKPSVERIQNNSDSNKVPNVLNSQELDETDSKSTVNLPEEIPKSVDFVRDTLTKNCKENVIYCE